MIKANDLRIGNIIWHTHKNVDTNKIEDIETVVDGNLIKSLELHPYLGYNPIPLTPEVLEKAGFKKLPHFTVQNLMDKSIGRGRVISIGCVGTPNEMVFITEEDRPKVNAVIVLRNFDYDGKTYLHNLQNIYHSITRKELTLNLCTATNQNGDL